jgi:molecular chaperone GrpE
MESKEQRAAPEAPHTAQATAAPEGTAESEMAAAADNSAGVAAAEARSTEQPSQGTERTPETVEAELTEQQKKAEEYLDHLQRLQAEFQNYRRRVTQEKLQAASRGKEEVLVALFPILANLQLALQHADQDAAAVRQGVQMIWQQCEGFLRDQKVERLATVGERFDPAFHEVLSTVPATAETPADTIVTEVKPGYLFEGRLLCPARVIVAKTEPSVAAFAPEAAP